jgi:signal transduction histidine kinase
MVLILGLALIGSVAVTWEMLALRADAEADDELRHEVRKFQAFAGSEVARDHRRVDALLGRYLQDNLPDSYETFFSVVDGRADRRSQGTPSARLDRDPVFVARAAAADRVASGWTDSAAGRVRYAFLPVRVAGDPQRATLVGVEFRDELAEPLVTAGRVFAGVAGGALVVAGVASWLVAGRVLAPIRLVRTTAEQITAGDLRRRIPVSGRDDVADLAATFNLMLDRLEEAFATQRQFLDDAGHELRTPLTVLRGHLELLDDDPARRAHTRALVLDEVQRMNRIVDDLLVLAKAERPDFLTLEDVDLADLTIDVVDKARPVADRRWSVDAVADAVVAADGQRLTQALLQLIANAVRHTEDGDRISVGTRVDPDAVRLWVADSGPGVPAADRARIFGRFARGSRPAGHDGAGLGLAIVQSIAVAHGGRVLLESPPGAGATFVVELPTTAVRRRGADEPDDVETARVLPGAAG